MKRSSILTIWALSLLAVSCMPPTTGGSEDNGTEIKTRKISKLSSENREDTFMIKFASTPDPSDVSDMESALGTSLAKVFHSTPGKEELEKQFGLDRWYEVEVPENRNVDEMVYRAASFDQVAVAEYSAIPVKDGEEIFYAPDPATKASADFPFNDTYLSYQWHYKNIGDRSFSPNCLAGADINVVDVWKNLTGGDPDIIVAVVDEAVKYTHPDLKANMWSNTTEIAGNGVDDDGNGYIDDVYGFNFVTAKRSSQDAPWDNGAIEWTAAGNSGHGTHCAGTIAAVNNNGTGVAGVAGGTGNADGCRIMSCQVFSGEAGGSPAVLARAVKYAADMGASVISASLGYKRAYTSDNNYISSQGSVEIDAIHYFEASRNNPVLNGNIAIFAAGNENHDYAHYPGAFVDIISVSAFGPDGLPAYYTNYGPGCNISAPGGEAYHVVNRWNSMILSTVPSELGASGIDGEFNKTGLNYGYMQGTSMACPHVSGVVALALSYAKKIGKTFDRDEFKQIILSSVNDIDQRIAGTSSKTYAYYQKPLEMAPYYHQMGTGAIDAWRLMMNIEGTPTLTSQIGRSQWLDLTSAFGTASVSLTFLKVEVPSETVNSLGLQKIEPSNTKKYPAVEDENGYAYIQFGRLYVNPSKLGSGKIIVHAVGGGDHLGGGNNPPGGMELRREVSIIARSADGGNGTGGWL